MKLEGGKGCQGDRSCAHVEPGAVRAHALHGNAPAAHPSVTAQLQMQKATWTYLVSVVLFAQPGIRLQRRGDEVPVAIGRQNMDIASKAPAVNVGSGCPARRTVFFVRAGHGCQDAAAARVCTLR